MQINKKLHQEIDQTTKKMFSNLNPNSQTLLVKSEQTLKGLQSEDKRIIQNSLNQQNLEDLSQYQDQAGDNFLNSQMKSRPKRRTAVLWSAQEDETLFRSFLIHGSKWSQLVQYLPTKNDNDIKNHFYCCLKRLQKELTAVQKLKKIKSNKLLRSESLLTVLEIGKFDYNTLDNRFEKIKKNAGDLLKARDLIVELAQNSTQLQKSTELQQLARLMVQLKHCLKFINMRRVKKSAQKSSQIDQQKKKETMIELIPKEADSKIVQEVKQEVIEQDTGFDDNMFDIDTLSEHLLAQRIPKNLSLIESCKDVLCPTIVSKEKLNCLFFIQ